MKNISSENGIEFQRIDSVIIPEIFNHRIRFGNTVLDKAFGGEGVLPGSSYTFDAAKGAGKTTLHLQILNILAECGMEVGITSGEECKEQLAYTAKRLGVGAVRIASFTRISDICNAAKELDWLVVDSWQRVVQDDGSSIRTEHHQKEAIAQLVQAGKDNNCVIGVILQRTKTGKAKGASEIQHTVDANYQLDIDERNESIRILSSDKNRFGCLSEMALNMGGHGFDLESCADDEDDLTALSNNMAPANNMQVRQIKASADRKKILEVLMNTPEGLVMSRLHKEAGMSYQKAMELSNLMLNEGAVQFDGRKWCVNITPTISLPDAQ